MPGTPATAIRDLEEARLREAAMRDILELISRSREDAAPVFDAILRRVAGLCDAHSAALVLGKPGDSHQRMVAQYGVDPATVARYDRGGVSMDPTASFGAQAIVSGKVVHVDDVIDCGFFRGQADLCVSVERDTGVRTEMLVPLLEQGAGIGCFVIFRIVVRPFTPDEIALAETFAAQAVIAIENARQFRELQTRLAREAATREILEVISRSRDDDRPVFDAILQNATRLCGADSAALLLGTPEGPHLTLAALWQWDSLPREDLDRFIADINRVPMAMDPALHISARAICTAAIAHIHDLAETEGYLSGEASFRFMVEDQGVRTTLSVPIFGARGPIGSISVHRNEVRPYGGDEIALIQSFAAQAVIAIENVRQFRELQTRLAREAATRRILEAISTSRDDELQIFDAILEEAARLCEATMAGLLLVTDDRTRITYARKWGEDHSSFREGEGWPFDGPLLVSSAIREAKVFHSADLADSDLYRDRYPERVRMVEGEGIRSYLVVPMVLGGIGIGVINLGRRHVGAFLPDEIALVETFAAQAVIAIENVRQFREVQTRLEREAATREILEVISQSRDDDKPVFDVVLRKAADLCHTPMASLFIISEDRSHAVIAADLGLGESIGTIRVGTTVFPLDSDFATSTCMREGRIVHLDDMADSDLYRSGDPIRTAAVDEDGLRTLLAVPLFGSGRTVGCISVYRREVKPFSLDEIALVETFAAQAVIAIENVRQFKALEALNAELGHRVDEQVGEIERMGRLKRFLPAAVADAVVSSGSEKMLSSHRALLGVLFCDIRGFTAFCETAEPEETIEVLQTYHEEMGRLINAHGAGVDHRMGDGIMVLFNDPLPCADPAGDAVRLAMAMRARMAELCRQWKKMGHRLGFGVGIALGYATVGMVGSGGRFDYTASGTAINLASRLCDEAQDGEILISPRTRLAVDDDFTVESRGEIAFKGIREPVEVCCVTGVVG